MKKKLTSAVKAKAKSMRQGGATIAEIQAKLGLSAGSVVNATKAQTFKSPAGKPSEPTADAAEPPSADEIRRYLGEAVRNLRDECTKAKTSGDSAAFASASRNLTSATQLLAKLTPNDDPTEKLGVYVTLSDMAAAAAKCREKLTDLWEKTHAEKPSEAVR